MKYFSSSEFVMGGEPVYNMMDSYLLTLLDDLREAVGEPLSITSSYRSVEYNKKIGGHPGSQHIEGTAVDISCRSSALRYKILKYAAVMGFTGIGVSATFIHLDVRDSTPVVWTY